MGGIVLLGHYFNPRSPWGERLGAHRLRSEKLKFQSTLPVGGATRQADRQQQASLISIHAPRGGSDDTADGAQHRPPDFNPRSPWGERPAGGATPD